MSAVSRSSTDQSLVREIFRFVPSRPSFVIELGHASAAHDSETGMDREAKPTMEIQPRRRSLSPFSLLLHPNLNTSATRAIGLSFPLSVSYALLPLDLRSDG